MNRFAKGKRILRRLPLFLTLLVGGLHVLSATQVATAQRTVEVAPGFGTLNDAISSDTTATGARVDSNTVYMLTGGTSFEARYYLNGRIRSGDFHLQIVNAPGSTQPAVLQVLTDATGASSSRMIQHDGDLTIRGLYLLGADDLDAPRAVMIQIEGDAKTLIVDDCFVDYNRFITFRFNGAEGNFRLTNSHIRNVMTTNNPGNGKVIDPRGNVINEVYIENTTFEGVSAGLTRLSGALFRSLFFNHNTIWTMGGFIRDDVRSNSNKIVKARITNNHFINMGWPGDSLSAAWIDPPSHTRAGIFSFDSLSTVPGVSETDRDIVISNNNFYWDQELVDFFNSGYMTSCTECSGGTLKQWPIFNPRAQTFVDAGLVRFDNAIEDNPEFVNTPPISNYITWTTDYWALGASEVFATTVYYDPDGPQNVDTWPVPEDFSYPTTKASYTGGTGGFPLGDLNWFPAQKAAWEAVGGGTSSGTDFGIIVANEDPDEVPTGFVLRGNYPNPFNPSTTIDFDLNVPAEVSVSVFDVLGRQVLTTPALQVAAGARQQIRVNASSLASGVYLYRVTARSATQTLTAMGRMSLIK
ncbi:MAG: T9SS type A sorting domain-containing protein [Gammaproteobacteria bacterium]|nr:T9SS type A sorting domain-containing protein [Gammaproteobacteria bacterium]